MMKASQALRNQYVIGYQPADSDTSGKLHRIRVKSTVPKVTVHARSAYYALRLHRPRHRPRPAPLKFLLLFDVASEHEAGLNYPSDLVVFCAQRTEDVALGIIPRVNEGKVSANEEATGLIGGGHRK